MCGSVFLLRSRPSQADRFLAPSCPLGWAAPDAAHLGRDGRPRARRVVVWMRQAWRLRLRGPIWNVPTLSLEVRNFSLLDNSCAEKVAHLAGGQEG